LLFALNDEFATTLVGLVAVLSGCLRTKNILCSQPRH
jgi:hypothetical protein